MSDAEAIPGGTCSWRLSDGLLGARSLLQRGLWVACLHAALLTRLLGSIRTVDLSFLLRCCLALASESQYFLDLPHMHWLRVLSTFLFIMWPLYIAIAQALFIPRSLPYLPPQVILATPMTAINNPHLEASHTSAAI